MLSFTFEVNCSTPFSLACRENFSRWIWANFHVFKFWTPVSPFSRTCGNQIWSFEVQKTYIWKIYFHFLNKLHATYSFLWEDGAHGKPPVTSRVVSRTVYQLCNPQVPFSEGIQLIFTPALMHSCAVRGGQNNWGHRLQLQLLTTLARSFSYSWHVPSCRFFMTMSLLN